MHKRIALPTPSLSSATAVARIIAERRSVRRYGSDPVSVTQLSLLLQAAQGVTGAGDRRAAPSAGSVYPLQAYTQVRAVTGISPGLYRYDAVTHSVEWAGGGCPAKGLREAALEDQPWVENAALVIVIAADFELARRHFETQPPLGQRGAQYIFMETGTAAQNVHLQATELGLGMVLVAGLDDARIKESLQLSPALRVTALLCVGRPRPEDQTELSILSR